MPERPISAVLERWYYRAERWAWRLTGWRWLPGLTLRVMDRQHRKQSNEGTTP